MIGVSINPTTLKVGTTGMLKGDRATVVGRAVLRSADGYRWYEYYVQLNGGRIIVLVYEAGDWKRFEEFAGPAEFTAKKAETCRTGDSVELHDNRAEVKYVSASQVLYVEGRTLNGVRTGTVARYFNAECDNETIVVSWTGEQIEFYWGKKLSPYIVPHAFKLPEPSFWRKLIWGGSGSVDSGVNPAHVFAAIAIVIVAFALIPILSSQNGSVQRIDPAPVRGAPTIQLQEGERGTLAGTSFVVRGRATVEIDEMGMRFRRYEYDLADEQGTHAWLIESLNGNSHDWALFREQVTPGWLGPIGAASMKEGGSLRIGTLDTKVLRLFQSRSIGGDGFTAKLPPSGTIRYGFLAQAGDVWMLARWDEKTLELEEGRSVPEATVLSAFGITASR